MCEPFRSTLPPEMFRPRLPLWLARILAVAARQPPPDDGTGDTYEVTLARYGRPLEIVTVQARSEAQAVDRAQRYLAANIYPLSTVKVEGGDG